MPRTTIDPDLQVSVQTAPFEEEGTPDLVDRLTILGEHKLFILKFTAVATVLALIISILLPKVYEANTKIMPPQQSPSAAAAVLGQLNPLALLAGRDLGLRNPSDIYIDMLRSRTVADDLIQRFSLLEVYHDKDIVAARKDLERNSDIEAAKDSMISVAVSDRDPQRAADLANAYVEELQKLTRTLAVTEAGRRRIFFEQEVQKAGEDLATAEQALKQTQVKTGIIHLESQAKAMIESLTYLQAQLTAREAEVEAMRSFATPDNPEFVRARQEVESLRAELAKVQSGQGGTSLADISTRSIPESGLEYLRRLRDVHYHESLWEQLTKQYEIARIDEAKEATIIQVLDPGLRPIKKARPQRALIVLISMLAALCIACMYVLFAQSWRRANENPLQAARLQRLKLSLFRWRKPQRSSRDYQ